MDFREVSHSSVSREQDHIYTGGVSSRPAETVNLILSSLPADMQRALRPHLKPVALTKEQFIYQEEDKVEFIYFPETAVVSEFKILEDGRMVEIAVTGKEGAVGLPSIFSDSHFSPNCTQVSQAGTAMRIDA